MGLLDWDGATDQYKNVNEDYYYKKMSESNKKLRDIKELILKIDPPVGILSNEKPKTTISYAKFHRDMQKLLDIIDS